MTVAVSILPFPAPVCWASGMPQSTLSMAAASVPEGSSLGARAGDCDHHPSLPNFNDQLNSLDTETSDYYSDNDDFDQDFPRFNKFDSIDFDYYSINKFNLLCKNKQNFNNCLQIIHFNIRGLNKNVDNLVTFLSSLKHSFDVITLSECHISNTNCDNRFKILLTVILSLVDVQYIAKLLLVQRKLLVLPRVLTPVIIRTSKYHTASGVKR